MNKKKMIVVTEEAWRRVKIMVSDDFKNGLSATNSAFVERLIFNEWTNRNAKENI